MKIGLTNSARGVTVVVGVMVLGSAGKMEVVAVPVVNVFCVCAVPDGFITVIEYSLAGMSDLKRASI